MKEVNTLLFSDVHLGSPVARAFDLLNTLKEYRFKKLIIVGDMFEDLNFKHLTSTHWELLEHIGKVSRRGVEVVWIEGNHDGKFLEFMSHMIGIPARKEYSWEVNGRKFLTLHGHQFDNFLSSSPLLGRFFAAGYSFLQRRISSSFVSFISDKIADKWQRLSEQVAEMALAHCAKKGRDVVICGHTHFVYQLRKNNIEYYNLGCWVSKPSYILVVEENGGSHFEVIP
jgi:UDP-2,3-diacylglucosamine pyrophosphatase LpxH